MRLGTLQTNKELPELEGLWPVLICNGGDGRSTDQILGTRTTTLSSHGAPDVQQSRVARRQVYSGGIRLENRGRLGS